MNNNQNKKKNTPRKIAIAIILIAIIGSLLGTASFIENRVRYASASINPLDTSFNLTNATMEETLVTVEGVTTNIGNPDYKNFGWAGWNSLEHGWVNKPITLIRSENITVVQYGLNGTNTRTITPFVTFSKPITLQSNKKYAIEISFYFEEIENVRRFEFYFLGGERIDLLKYKDSYSPNDIGFYKVSFEIENTTDNPIQYSSYRMEIEYNNYKASFTLQYVNINEGTYQNGYDVGYQQGKQEGFEEGFEQGKNEGYQEGYEEGVKNSYQEGYNDGYFDGELDGMENGQTLYGMILGIFDAPIHVFTEMFNFEVLGVNLAGLVFSLLTLLIIVFIIRKFV